MTGIGAAAASAASRVEPKAVPLPSASLGDAFGVFLSLGQAVERAGKGVAGDAVSRDVSHVVFLANTSPRKVPEAVSPTATAASKAASAAAVPTKAAGTGGEAREVVVGGDGDGRDRVLLPSADLGDAVGMFLSIGGAVERAGKGGSGNGGGGVGVLDVIQVTAALGSTSTAGTQPRESQESKESKAKESKDASPASAPGVTNGARGKQTSEPKRTASGPKRTASGSKDWQGNLRKWANKKPKASASQKSSAAKKSERSAAAAFNQGRSAASTHSLNSSQHTSSSSSLYSIPQSAAPRKRDLVLLEDGAQMFYDLGSLPQQMQLQNAELQAEEQRKAQEAIAEARRRKKVEEEQDDARLRAILAAGLERKRQKEDEEAKLEETRLLRLQLEQRARDRQRAQAAEAEARSAEAVLASQAAARRAREESDRVKEGDRMQAVLAAQGTSVPLVTVSPVPASQTRATPRAASMKTMTQTMPKPTMSSAPLFSRCCL